MCSTVRTPPQRHASRPLRHRAPARPYHEHNAQRERPRILAELAAGKSVALISDAGTPLVSDPGYKLVREALAAGHRVVEPAGAERGPGGARQRRAGHRHFSVRGLSAAQGRRARRARLAELQEVPATLVLFEAPSRLAESLEDIAHGARPPRGGRGARADQAARGGAPRHARRACQMGGEASPKGEMVVLVGPPLPPAVTDEAIAAKLTPMLLCDESQRCRQGGRPRSWAWPRPASTTSASL